jgi:hypothetical protein
LALVAAIALAVEAAKPDALLALVGGAAAVVPRAVPPGESLEFSGPNGQVVPCRGAVWTAEAAVGDLFHGTYLGGDGFTGELISAPVTVTAPVLSVPVLGYPALPGNALLVLSFAGDGKLVRYRAFAGADPGERPGVWTLRLAVAEERAVRLMMRDGLTESRGWLGVGPVHFGHVPLVAQHGSWGGQTTDYAAFAIAVALVLMLLVLPGLALHAVARPGAAVDLAAVPIPGFLALAGFGLAVWLSGGGPSNVMARGYFAANAAMAGYLAIRRARPPAPASAFALVPFAALATSALAYGVLPLPVAHEAYARTTAQDRLVASPGDSFIPHLTAAYFYHGKDGREDRELYFGDWSVASRGPVVPLAITGLFALFQVGPDDLPTPRQAPWPAAPDGVFLSRILGTLANAWIVLAALRFLSALGASRDRQLFGVAWLAVAPVTAINTLFLWPKLLAAGFLLLAAAEALRAGRAARTAAWAALAWLSHPVGALYLPAIGTLLLFRVAARHPGGLRAGIARATAFAAGTLLLMLPWLAFKAYVAHPDVFFRYPLGDGRTLAPAASVGSWFAARASNLVHTWVPGAFFFSEHMHVWSGEFLSSALRWTVQYAKSLPAGVGFCLCGLAFVRLAARAGEVARAVKLHLVVVGTVVMLAFWGYSADGLGRNCIEPLSAIVILIAAAAGPVGRLAKAALVGVTLETAWVGVSGLILHADFAPGLLRPEALAVGAVWIVALALPCWMVWRRAREATPEQPADVQGAGAPRDVWAAAAARADEAKSGKTQAG